MALTFEQASRVWQRSKLARYRTDPQKIIWANLVMRYRDYLPSHKVVVAFLTLQNQRLQAGK